MKLLKNIISNRIVQHLVFWGLAFFVLINLFTDSAFEKVDYIYTFLFVMTLQLAVYTHRIFIVGRLQSKQLLYFMFLSGGVVVIFALFNYYFFDAWVDKVLPGYYFISYYKVVDLILYFLVFITLTTFLKLSKDWWLQEDAKNKLVKIEKEKTEMELKALVAQVNPHFLFNSLNVLYSLAIKESTDSPEAILKLSDVLRYVIYDSNKEKVKLSQEVDLINSYLGLQAYRTGNNTQVDFSTDISQDLSLAPLLFLPLIENSFKHGVKGDIDSTYVAIKLSSDDKNISFFIKNNKGKSSAGKLEVEGGIGLANIRQRLELLYSGRYDFIVNEGEKDFEVILKIDVL